MIVEKRGLYHFALETVKRDIDLGILPADDEKNPRLKVFLKKDSNEPETFSVIDEEYSVKCIFDEKNLKTYKAEMYPYMKWENINSILFLKSFRLSDPFKEIPLRLFDS
jgi:hypothetical protein